ncbi:MAG: hypothetical protein ACJ8CB_21050 [Ktedonobacteraceae bacterium]
MLLFLLTASSLYHLIIRGLCEYFRRVSAIAEMLDFCYYALVAKLTDVSPNNLRHGFGYWMAESVPLHRLVHIMGHDSLDTTTLSIQGTRHDLQQAVETIAWT